MTDRFLDEMDDDDAEHLFKRLGELIKRAVPRSRLGGQCGWVLILVDQAKGMGTPPTAARYTGTVPIEDTPEVLHEIADIMEQELDEQRGSD